MLNTVQIAFAGGKWSNPYIPACQEVYCGPVPQV